MSYRILESVENISSCLKTLKNVEVAQDFYDNINIGKYIDKFHVCYNSKEYVLYVLKSDNERCGTIVSNALVTSGFGEASSFVSSSFYPKELICFKGDSGYIYYDIVLVENPVSDTLLSILKRSNIFSQRDNYIFVQLKKVVVELLWLVESKIYIDNLLSSDILVSSDVCRFNFNEHTKIYSQTLWEEENIEFTRFEKDVFTRILSLWMLFFVPEQNYLLIEQLSELNSSSDLQKFREENLDGLLGVCEDILSVSQIDLKPILLFLLNRGVKNEATSAVRAILDVEEVDSEEIATQSNGSLQNYIKDSGYQICSPIIESRVVIKDIESQKFGYSDAYGNVVCKAQFEEATTFSESRAVVKLCDGYYAIDNEGGFVTTFAYDLLEWFCSINRFIAKKDECYYLLDRDATVLNSEVYSWIGEFSCGFAVVEDKTTNLKGYINLEGEKVVDAKFNEAYAFDNFKGKAIFGIDWYVITADGELIKE